MREQFQRALYNHLIKNLNICNIPLSESENATFDKESKYIRDFMTELRGMNRKNNFI